MATIKKKKGKIYNFQAHKEKSWFNKTITNQNKDTGVEKKEHVFMSIRNYNKYKLTKFFN